MNLLNKLQSLKEIKPNQDWVDSQRNVLLSQIKQQDAEVKQSFFINTWYLMKSFMPTRTLEFIAKPVGIFTLLGILIFGSGMFGVNASRNSLPGDMLYSLKLTTERVKVGLVTEEEKKAELQVEFAEERVNEIEQIIKTDDNDYQKQEKIKIAADGLKNDMVKVSDSINKVKQEKGSDESVLVSIKDINRKVDAITQKLNQSKESSKTKETEKEVVKILTEAENVSERLAEAVVGVIIEKIEKAEGQDENEIMISDSEILSLVDKKLTKLKAKKEDFDKVYQVLINGIQDNNLNLPARSATSAAGGQDDGIQDDNLNIQDDGIQVDEDLSQDTDDSNETTDDSSEVTDDSTETTDDSSEDTDDSSETTDDSIEDTDDSNETTDESIEDTDDLNETTDESSEDTEDSNETTDESIEDTDDSSEVTDDSNETTDDSSEVTDKSLSLAQFEAIKEFAEGLQTNVEKIETMMNTGDLEKAILEVTNLREQIVEYINQVEVIIEKYNIKAEDSLGLSLVEVEAVVEEETVVEEDVVADENNE